MAVYVVSKASQNIAYIGWLKGKNGLNKKEKTVVIKGGANVLNKKTLETVNGVVNEITAEDLKFLESLSSFKRHVAGGWMVVCKTKTEAEKKADQQEKNTDGTVKKDGSAQLTAEDFEVKGQKPPVVNPDEMNK